MTGFISCVIGEVRSTMWQYMCKCGMTFLHAVVWCVRFRQCTEHSLSTHTLLSLTANCLENSNCVWVGWTFERIRCWSWGFCLTHTAPCSTFETQLLHLQHCCFPRCPFCRDGCLCYATLNRNLHYNQRLMVVVLLACNLTCFQKASPEGDLPPSSHSHAIDAFLPTSWVNECNVTHDPSWWADVPVSQFNYRDQSTLWYFCVNPTI